MKQPVSTPLGELCRLITDGKHGDCENQAESGFYFLSAKDVRDGKLNYEDARQITEKDFLDTHRRTRLEPNDLVISNSGTIGRMALVTNRPETSRTTFQKSVAILKPKHERVLASWLYYYLHFDLERLIGFAGGTAQKNLLLRDLRTFSINLQPLPTQRNVAGILSAYDNLIENNTRRIAILEKMAQAIYREWFVNVRFPGHEKAKLIDSPLGKIPERCEAPLFGDILASMRGGDWGSEQPTAEEDQGVVVVRGTDFDEVAYGGNLRVPLRYITASSIATRQLHEGDVIVENSVNAKSRCIGTPLLVDQRVLSRLKQPAIAASFCKVFRFHDPSIASVAYWHLRHLRRIKRMEYYQNTAANGIGNFQAQRFAHEETLLMPVDPAERSALISQLSDVCESVSNLASRIANLRTTRDLLLPKLFGGQLEVEDLDIETGELLVESEP